MRIKNKRARFNYQLLDKFEAGLVLTGAEVKSIRAGQANISRAYARIIGGEAYLINANFSGSNVKKPTRSRKLLLHKKQLISLATQIKAKNLTIVPVSLYTTGQLIKVELALAKSKKRHQKREVLRRKDIEREIERELKLN